MIRTGAQYRDSIRDDREIYINGERVKDVTTHPMFKPLVDIRARIYDMPHETKTQEAMTYVEDGERFADRLASCPTRRRTGRPSARAIDAVMWDIGGVVTRVGDETVGEMWSLWDGKDILDEIDPRFAKNIETHIHQAIKDDPFHVSANTDPKGDRSKRPQDQDPDLLVHVVKETDAGIVIRGAKYETAAAYANQAFLKPTIANWGDAKLSDYAVGCIVKMNAPGVKHICRTGFAGRARPARLSARQPLRRGRHADDPRQRADPLGGRAVLPAHPGRRLHPPDAAPLLGLPLRPADPRRRRHADRRGAVERPPDRPRQAAGGAGEARRARRLPRRHQRPSDGGDRHRREEPRRPADAEPVAALHRPRPRLHAAAGDDAHRPRALRRPDLRHPGRGRLRDRRRPSPGWKSITRSTSNGWRRTAASCWRSPAIS